MFCLPYVPVPKNEKLLIQNFSTLSQQLCCLYIESFSVGAFVKISSCVRGKLTSFFYYILTVPDVCLFSHDMCYPLCEVECA